MQARNRADAFAVLRKALKARGMTYAELAARLDVSEPTIKRLFADKDCKFSRLLQVCEALEVPLSDVIEQTERAPEAPEYLKLEVEEALAASPGLFQLFILLREAIPEGAIMRRYSLTKDDLFRYGQDLERLGLGKVMSGGRIIVPTERPIRFRRPGPLAKLVRATTLHFVSAMMNRSERAPQPDEAALTISRSMSPQTARLVSDEIEALNKRIAKLARQDQLMYEASSLRPFKLSAAWGRVSFPDLFRIPPHPHAQQPQPVGAQSD